MAVSEGTWRKIEEAVSKVLDMHCQIGRLSKECSEGVGMQQIKNVLLLKRKSVSCLYNFIVHKLMNC